MSEDILSPAAASSEEAETRNEEATSGNTDSPNSFDNDPMAEAPTHSGALDPEVETDIGSFTVSEDSPVAEMEPEPSSSAEPDERPSSAHSPPVVMPQEDVSIEPANVEPVSDASVESVPDARSSGVAEPHSEVSVEPLADVRPPSVRSSGSASGRVQSPKSTELPPVLSARGSQSSIRHSTTSSQRADSPGNKSQRSTPASAAGSRDVSRQASREGSRPSSRPASQPASARQEVRFEAASEHEAGSISRVESALERSLAAVKSASSLFEDDDDEDGSSDDQAESDPDDGAPALDSARGLRRAGSVTSQTSYSVDENADKYSIGTTSLYGGKRSMAGPAGATETDEDQQLRLGDARKTVMKRLQDAREAQQRLLAANEVLQATVAKQFRVNKIDTKDQLGQPDTKNPALTDEERVELQMKLVHDKCDDLKTLRMYYDELTQEMKKRLEEKESKAQEVNQLFLKFKREIAREAEDSKTGRTISPQLIEHYEQEEIKKDGDVEKVRLKNITLRKKYSSLEKSLRAKEELKNGLHLIDFEQLKIENQTFNEKIEERNEELAKMRKKINNTVHILSHVKEKLQVGSQLSTVPSWQLDH
eukprot:TRINITY_DN299_c0_g5_i2.p1 TRINITY_DN299_c0_g5~~TRINITY_DN299_c0_g5_i2.p1  ORF type:complete len:594 (-),score=147.98 TRINITY_DN299_c0_g5_i2:1243-3024(-)